MDPWINQSINQVTHFIGSALSKDRSLAEVADEKEAKLRQHYGEGFWDSARDVSLDALKDATVCDVDFLMAAGPASCDVVLSFLAPRFGHVSQSGSQEVNHWTRLNISFSSRAQQASALVAHHRSQLPTYLPTYLPLTASLCTHANSTDDCISPSSPSWKTR